MHEHILGKNLQTSDTQIEDYLKVSYPKAVEEKIAQLLRPPVSHF